MSHLEQLFMYFGNILWYILPTPSISFLCCVLRFVCLRFVIWAQCCLCHRAVVLCFELNVVCVTVLSFCVLSSMLFVSLGCRSVFWIQCCLCLWIVVLWFELNVVCVCGLLCCLFSSVLSVSLDCRSVFWIQCCLCHWVVVLCSEFNVVCVTGLSFCV